jgi:hypothetical protein
LVLELLERNRRVAELMAQYGRVCGGAAALQELKYRFWADTLQHLHPIPGQRHDTALTDVIIKRSTEMPSAALGIVDFETIASGGWLITAAGRVDGALKTALERQGGIALTEMHNRGLGTAGEVRSCKVEGGVARLVARIAPHAETVVRKIRHQVLPFIEIIHDDAGNVLDCSLVDRPDASDGLEKGGRVVLAKLYRRKENDPVKFEKGATTVTLKKRLKKQAQQREELAQFIVNHRMTGADNAVDQAVFKALYGVRQPVGQRPWQPVQSALGLLTGRR